MATATHLANAVNYDCNLSIALVPMVTILENHTHNFEFVLFRNKLACLLVY
jgi:hypothetical protein